MQHVWVHYDYMVGPNGESYAPDPAGIQIVVDSFKRHGVILHIDPQHTAIPLHSVIVFDAPGNGIYSFDPACTGPDAVGFSALKAQYFHPTSDHPWHYVIFAKYVQVDSETNLENCLRNGDFPGGFYGLGNTGYAELPGYDFVVTPGLIHDTFVGQSGCWADFQTGALLPCWPLPDYAWATMFMHELGHNLGLYHGGYGRTVSKGAFITDNYKPNYVSVMNYAYSTGAEPIITSSTTTGSGYWYRVDYSDEALPPLDERNLDESAGIGPTLHPTDYIYWCCQFNGFAPAGGPIDWNLNGTATDAGYSADLNQDGDLSILKGFNDWDEVHQYLTDEDKHPKQTQSATP